MIAKTACNALLLLFICTSLFFCQNVTAQSGQRISGKVSDETGTALGGVSVTLKGTTRGTSTGSTGNFSITSAAQNPMLVFSYVGYLTKEMQAENGQVSI